MFLSSSVYAEKEYQFDIILEPEYFVNYYFDGENIIAIGDGETTVYNQRMEKIDKPVTDVIPQNNGKTEIPLVPAGEYTKYPYACMSEFKNGFSFVRDQGVDGLPLGYDSSVTHYLFEDSVSDNSMQKAREIAEQTRSDYKFINENGDVIFNHLDADVVAYSYHGTITEPWSGCGVAFTPSYFNEYGLAIVKCGGKFGIINTNGELLCDFLYDGITIYNENIAIIENGDVKKFYYLKSGMESEFSAYRILPLKDNFFNFYERNGSKGVIDCHGNMVLPDRQLYFIGENNAITYVAKGQPTDIYYNKDFEVVCYSNVGVNQGTCDSYGNVIWDDYQLCTHLGNFGNIYVLRNWTKGALAAINEIPEPTCKTGDKYISIMFNNPLVNVSGCTRTIEAKNYFYTPVVRNDRILLPYELLGELGMWTVWDKESQTLSVGKKGNVMVLNVDSNEAYLNSKRIYLDIPMQIIEERVLIPYETIAVALGADWDWDGANNILTLFFE